MSRIDVHGTIFELLEFRTSLNNMKEMTGLGLMFLKP
jgi:hypothetical protein